MARGKASTSFLNSSFKSIVCTLVLDICHYGTVVKYGMGVIKGVMGEKILRAIDGKGISIFHAGHSYKNKVYYNTGSILYFLLDCC